MKQKILRNIYFSLLLEIINVICAFIIPPLILSKYGSEYNGIVASVTQFLSVVTLMRGGIGGVTRAALFKPLVENDFRKISMILNATEKFMRKITRFFVVFLFLFAVIYPLVVVSNFKWFYAFSLVLILGISTFAEYYFGITYQILLIADQKSYVLSLLQSIAVIFNTLSSVFLINNGVDFRFVKLFSALIFAMVPIVLYLYVHRIYVIDKNVEGNDTFLKQRWDAFAHQVAAFIHSNTSLVLLTLFSNLYEVSVYSIYLMILTGVRKFTMVCSSGIEATFGKLIATNEYKKLAHWMSFYEFIINIIATSVFVSTALLIIPFIHVYTLNINDVNYIRPAMGNLLCLGFLLQCIRLPYQNIVEAAGHFKNTKNDAILEALINICVSLLFIQHNGALGVALGFIVSMAFRTCQYAVYASKNILNCSCRCFWKRFIVTILNVAIIMIMNLTLETESLFYVNNLIEWAVCALFIFMLVTGITFVFNSLIYTNEFQILKDNLFNKIHLNNRFKL